ncbi:MAG: polysulfide reductase NrfD [Anaerosomatales bacterium]|nr:polysulfide reductase NrfD [Anaerosomatales bacterium]
MSEIATTTPETAAEPRPGIKRFINVDFNVGALKNAGPRYWTFIGLLAIPVTMFLVALGVLITRSGAVVAMRDTNPWGLWFIFYMYYVGLSAGGLAVYASVHLFGAEQFRPLARFAVLQAGVLVMCALLGIASEIPGPAADLGRMLWFLRTPNFTSPFVYTGSAAAIYMLICFFDLWVMTSGTGGHKLAFRMTLIALPFAVYLHTTTAFVLSMNKGRELWHTAVMVPIFLTSATASGVALLMIFAYILQATKQYRFKPSMFRSLSTFLATVIIIDIFLLLVEILVVYWPTSVMPGHVIRMNDFVTLGGRYAVVFLPVLILGITAFTLLARRSTRHLPAVQLTAAVLYVFAIFLKRYSLDVMGFSYTTLFQNTGIYIPSLVEWLMGIGIMCFGIMFVAIAIKVLPMEEPEEEHNQAEHHGSQATSVDSQPEPTIEGGVA